MGIICCKGKLPGVEGDLNKSETVEIEEVEVLEDSFASSIEDSCVIEERVKHS